MSGKYIDLADRIGEGAEYSNTTSFCLGIECALRWLDEHPDQVPGRTITESEAREAWHRACNENDGTIYERFAKAIGITVVPDPEPTNAERLTGLIENAVHSPAWASAEALADYLDDNGVKALGGDDEH